MFVDPLTFAIEYHNIEKKKKYKILIRFFYFIPHDTFVSFVMRYYKVNSLVAKIPLSYNGHHTRILNSSTSSNDSTFFPAFTVIAMHGFSNFILRGLKIPTRAT